MKKLLWILVPAALVAPAAVFPSACANTQTCQDLGTCGLVSAGGAGGAGGTGTGGKGTGGTGTGAKGTGGTGTGGKGTGGTGTGGTGTGGTGTGGSVVTAPLSVCVGKYWGDPQDQLARSLHLDTSNDVLLAGDFQGHVSFGGPPALDTSASTAFVVVLNPSLIFKWNKAVPAPSTYLASAFDTSGNVLLAATYPPGPAPDAGLPGDGGDGGSVVFTGPDLGCGPIDETKSSFVAKLGAASGTCAFSKTFGASPTRASLALDGSGNVLWAGGVKGLAAFGDVSSPTTTHENIFIVKLNSDGSFAWQRTLIAANDDEVTSVAVDVSGNVFVTGTFSGALDFGTGAPPLDSQGQTDIFVASLSPGGVTQWVTQLHGSDPGQAAGIAVAGSALFVAGTFGKSLDLNQVMLTSPGGALFAAKLNPATGSTTWAKAITGTSAAALAAGATGSTAIVGASGGDILVAQLDPSGNLTSQELVTGMAGSARQGNGIGLSANGLLLSGYFAGTLAGADGGSLVSNGGDDVFLLQRCP